MKSSEKGNQEQKNFKIKITEKSIEKEQFGNGSIWKIKKAVLKII